MVRLELPVAGELVVKASTVFNRCPSALTSRVMVFTAADIIDPAVFTILFADPENLANLVNTLESETHIEDSVDEDPTLMAEVPVPTRPHPDTVMLALPVEGELNDFPVNKAAFTVNAWTIDDF